MTRVQPDDDVVSVRQRGGLHLVTAPCDRVGSQDEPLLAADITNHEHMRAHVIDGPPYCPGLQSDIRKVGTLGRHRDGRFQVCLASCRGKLAAGWPARDCSL